MWRAGRIGDGDGRLDPDGSHLPRRLTLHPIVVMPRALLRSLRPGARQ